MSRAAKMTLLGTSLFAVSTVVFVHYAQQAEKAVSFPYLRRAPTVWGHLGQETNVCANRQCMLEWYEIWNSSASRRSVNLISTCRRP